MNVDAYVDQTTRKSGTMRQWYADYVRYAHAQELCILSLLGPKQLWRELCKHGDKKRVSTRQKDLIVLTINTNTL